MSEAYKRELLEKNEDEFDAAETAEEVDKFNKNPKAHSLDELRKINYFLKNNSYSNKKLGICTALRAFRFNDKQSIMTDYYLIC